jgi:hypothetical protein
MKHLVKFLVFFLIFILPVWAAPKTKKGQNQPDQKRVLEIQEALIAHNYMPGPPSGKWDDQTQNVLRKIADGYEWQIKHVPDARVLILLGLSKGSPEVIQKGNKLDQLVRGEVEEQ